MKLPISDHVPRPLLIIAYENNLREVYLRPLKNPPLWQIFPVELCRVLSLATFVVSLILWGAGVGMAVAYLILSRS